MRLDIRRVELAVLLLEGDEPGAAGHELGGIALILRQMACLQAIDRAPGRREGGQRQRIGRRAGGDGKHAARFAEEFAEALIQLRAQLIGAIGTGAARIGAQNGLHHFRRGAGSIVAAEIDHAASSVMTSGRGSKPLI